MKKRKPLWEVDRRVCHTSPLARTRCGSRISGATRIFMFGSRLSPSILHPPRHLQRTAPSKFFLEITSLSRYLTSVTSAPSRFSMPTSCFGSGPRSAVFGRPITTPLTRSILSFTLLPCFSSGPPGLCDRSLVPAGAGCDSMLCVPHSPVSH